MPHMDMTMSGEKEPDYSDYRYQHVDFEHTEAGGPSGLSQIEFSIEVLGTIGGLDTNEVAELVAMRVTTEASADDYEVNTQSEAGTAQHRGVIGANLGNTSDLPGNGQRLATVIDGGTVENGSIINSNDNSTAEALAEGHTKDEVFYHFQTSTGIPFDGSNGGGSNTSSNLNETVNFRELLGRGPVFDGNDDIGYVSTLVKNNATVNVEANTRVTFYWDIATVDDAGRQFAIPE